MPKILMPYTVHLDHTLRVTPVSTLFYKGDSNAHRFELNVLSKGLQADLSGCTAVYRFYRLQDSTVVSNPASIESGKVVAVLDKACYDYIGRFALTIAIQNGEDETTVFYGDGYMSGNRADTGITGDYVVYDVETLLAKIAEIETAIANANTAIANANTAAENANAAEENANAAASDAQSAADSAGAAASAANTAAGKANTAASAANTAASAANSAASSAHTATQNANAATQASQTQQEAVAKAEAARDTAEQERQSAEQARQETFAGFEGEIGLLKDDLDEYEKILFDKSSNLYNPALQTNETIAKHYYVDGKPYSSTQFDSAYNATSFIPVKPNKQYTVGLIPADGGFALPWANAMQGMFFYREEDDESYISTQKNQTFTTPRNAKYMRFTFAIVSGITLSVVNSRLVLVEGDTLPESYIPFYSKTLSDVVSENTSKIAVISNGMQSVLMSADSVSIRSRYSDAEDLIIKIGRHGGNNLIDFQQIGFVNRYAAGYSIDRMLIETESDFFSPHQIYADSNADGDHPDKTYFTGGSHTSDNASGGGATATNVRFDVYADGQSLSAGDTCIADAVVIAWSNLVNGYNTSKDDGTGRNILKEDIRLTIKGGKVTANVTHTALEALHRITYYGLQQRLTGFSTIRFVGGSNRAVIQTSANANSGSKNCRDVVMESSVGDCCRVHIDQTDIGDFDGNKAYPYSAFTSYGKSYFTLFAGASFAMSAGDQTMMDGYYRFYRS